MSLKFFAAILCLKKHVHNFVLLQLVKMADIQEQICSINADDYAQYFVEMLNLLSLYEIKLTGNVEQQMIKEANRAILDYCKNVQGEVYYEDYDIRNLIEEFCLQSRDVLRYYSNGEPYVDQEYEIDYDMAYQIVHRYIIEDVKEEIKSKFETVLYRYTSLQLFHKKISYRTF